MINEQAHTPAKAYDLIPVSEMVYTTLFHNNLHNVKQCFAVRRSYLAIGICIIHSLIFLWVKESRFMKSLEMQVNIDMNHCLWSMWNILSHYPHFITLWYHIKNEAKKFHVQTIHFCVFPVFGSWKNSIERKSIIKWKEVTQDLTSTSFWLGQSTLNLNTDFRTVSFWCTWKLFCVLSSIRRALILRPIYDVFQHWLISLNDPH